MPISGPTINTVYIPPSFVTLVYVLIVLAFIVGIAVFLSKNLRFPAAIKAALSAAFFISGLVWAFHADLGWATWLRDDLHAFGGLETDRKLLNMEGGMYDFARAARGVLGREYVLFASDDYLRLRFEYFLLPLRKREQAQDIVVLGDNTAQYDQAKRIFTRGTLTIADVDPILVYAGNAYILRKR